MTEAVDRCRICGNTELADILDLGNQPLSGVFPTERDQVVESAPLQLVRCTGDPNAVCGLLQLRHNADFSLMYGEHYGYRSGLNQAMVRHLKGKVERLVEQVQLGPDDLVIDIGSNDATLLSAYPTGPTLVGIDPVGPKFERFYPPHVRLIPEFFSADLVQERLEGRRAKVVTSIAMFYDLPDPMAFMADVHRVLADDGVWVLEQSYALSMLQANAYDIVCHEHLEYYALRQFEWMAERVGFRIVSAATHPIYGGSLSLTLAKSDSTHPTDTRGLATIREQEDRAGLHTAAPYEAFATHTQHHRDALRAFLDASARQGLRTLGYGASTKGNVLLHYVGIGTADLPCIAEVNEDKFGRFTPGTLIPIVSEARARALAPDQFLVLPWHFRDAIVAREQGFLQGGGKLVFPLPDLAVV
ncbi:MAG: class I SAM-dependent methyltransferase [Myxococcales bacterium]|nr:class I SAM-dependent methyltransferase [Myxococcales bacterium]